MLLSEISPINPEKRSGASGRNKSDIGLGRVENLSTSDILSLVEEKAKDYLSTSDNYRVSLPETTTTTEKYYLGLFHLKSSSTIQFSISMYNDIREAIDVAYIQLCVDNKNVSYHILATESELYLKNSNLCLYRKYFDGKKESLIPGEEIYAYIEFPPSIQNIQSIGINIWHYDTQYFQKLDSSEFLNAEKFEEKIFGLELITSKLPIRSTFEEFEGLGVYESSEPGDSNYNTKTIPFSSDDTDNPIPKEYDYPTINDVPFTGSRLYNNYLKNSYQDDKLNLLRKITVPAYHKGSDLESAGRHNWDVLGTYKFAGDNREMPRELTPKSGIVDITDHTQYNRYSTSKQFFISTANAILKSLGADSEVVPVSVVKELFYLLLFYLNGRVEDVLFFTYQNFSDRNIYLSSDGNILLDGIEYSTQDYYYIITGSWFNNGSTLPFSGENIQGLIAPKYYKLDSSTGEYRQLEQNNDEISVSLENNKFSLNTSANDTGEPQYYRIDFVNNTYETSAEISFGTSVLSYYINQESNESDISKFGFFVINTQGQQNFVSTSLSGIARYFIEYPAEVSLGYKDEYKIFFAKKEKGVINILSKINSIQSDEKNYDPVLLSSTKAKVIKHDGYYSSINSINEGYSIEVYPETNTTLSALGSDIFNIYYTYQGENYNLKLNFTQDPADESLQILGDTITPKDREGYYLATVQSSSTTVSITVQSNTSWVVNTDNSWITLSNTKGSGNGSFDINISASDTTNKRYGSVRVSTQTGKTLKCIDITQAESISTFFIIDESGNKLNSLTHNLRVKNVASCPNITITSDVNWSFTNKNSWITIRNESKAALEEGHSYGNSSNITPERIYIDISANTGTERTGSFSITGNNTTYTITVIQSQADSPEASFKDTSLKAITNLSYKSSDNGESVKKTLFAVINNDENAGIDSSEVSSWVTVSVDPSGTSTEGTETKKKIYVYPSSKNSDGVSRKGNLYVRTASGSRIASIPVWQQGDPQISLNQSSYTVPEEGGEKEFTITKNLSSWNISNIPAWIQIERTGNDKVKLTVEANKTGNSRNYSLVFNAKSDDSLWNGETINSTASAVLYISQNAYHSNGVIVTPESLTFSYNDTEEQSLSLSGLTNNTDNITIETLDWITLDKKTIESSGTDTDTVKVSMASSTEAERKGSISFYGFNKTLLKQVSVTQTKHVYLKIDDKEEDSSYTIGGLEENAKAFSIKTNNDPWNIYIQENSPFISFKISGDSTDAYKRGESNSLSIKGSKVIYIIPEKYTGSDESKKDSSRSNTIIISFGDITRRITVTQSYYYQEKTYVSIESYNTRIPTIAGSYSFKINTNDVHGWKAEIEQNPNSALEFSSGYDITTGIAEGIDSGYLNIILNKDINNEDEFKIKVYSYDGIADIKYITLIGDTSLNPKLLINNSDETPYNLSFSEVEMSAKELSISTNTDWSVYLVSGGEYSPSFISFCNIQNGTYSNNTSSNPKNYSVDNTSLFIIPSSLYQGTDSSLNGTSRQNKLVIKSGDITKEVVVSQKYSYINPVIVINGDANDTLYTMPSISSSGIEEGEFTVNSNGELSISRTTPSGESSETFIELKVGSNNWTLVSDKNTVQIPLTGGGSGTKIYYRCPKYSGSDLSKKDTSRYTHFKLETYNDYSRVIKFSQSYNYNNYLTINNITGEDNIDVSVSYNGSSLNYKIETDDTRGWYAKIGEGFSEVVELEKSSGSSGETLKIEFLEQNKPIDNNPYIEVFAGSGPNISDYSVKRIINLICPKISEYKIILYNDGNELEKDDNGNYIYDILLGEGETLIMPKIYGDGEELRYFEYSVEETHVNTGFSSSGLSSSLSGDDFSIYSTIESNGLSSEYKFKIDNLPIEKSVNLIATKEVIIKLNVDDSSNEDVYVHVTNSGTINWETIILPTSDLQWRAEKTGDTNSLISLLTSEGTRNNGLAVEVNERFISEDGIKDVTITIYCGSSSRNIILSQREKRN